MQEMDIQFRISSYGIPCTKMDRKQSRSIFLFNTPKANNHFMWKFTTQLPLPHHPSVQHIVRRLYYNFIKGRWQMLYGYANAISL